MTGGETPKEGVYMSLGYGPFGYGNYSCSYSGTSFCYESCSCYRTCQGTGDWHKDNSEDKSTTVKSASDTDKSKSDM